MSAVHDLAHAVRLSTTTTNDGAAVTVSVSGALDVLASADTRRTLASAVDAGVATLTIDLTAVAPLDAAGLASVTAPAMTARRSGIHVSFVLPSEPTARAVADQTGVLPLLGATR